MKPRIRTFFPAATMVGLLMFAAAQAADRVEPQAPALPVTLAQAMLVVVANNAGAQAQEQRATRLSSTDLATSNNKPGNPAPCGLQVAAGNRPNCGRDDRPISRR